MMFDLFFFFFYDFKLSFLFDEDLFFLLKNSLGFFKPFSFNNSYLLQRVVYFIRFQVIAYRKRAFSCCNVSSKELYSSTCCFKKRLTLSTYLIAKSAPLSDPGLYSPIRMRSSFFL